jgi:thiol-disulfide isomerase/thioredoxin
VANFEKYKISMKRKYSALREWAMLLGIATIAYVFGWHILLQRLALQTGIFNPSTELPKTAPTADYNFQLTDLEGNFIDFAQFKGKVVFMNFWATWCPPCIAEMPSIEALYLKMKSQNIAFVMISLDKRSDYEKVRAFLSKNKYSMPVYFLNNSLPSQYQANAIPRTYILSAKGTLIGAYRGMTNYNTLRFQQFLLQNR